MLGIIKKLILISVFTLCLSSCSNFTSLKEVPESQNNTPEVDSDSQSTSLKECPDAIIDWVDVLMIDDIKYQHHFPRLANENLSISIEKGREIGKVTFEMADSACSDHNMQNGDAAFLKEGTIIYEIKGYPTSLIVAANKIVYVADTNNKANTAGELYPMNKLVKNIYIQSTYDGKRMHTFSQSSKDKFIAAFYKLKLEDIRSLTDLGKLEGTQIFLEFELKNGVSFRQLYWSDSNTFHNGAIGNNEIKDVINDEVANLNK